MNNGPPGLGIHVSPLEVDNPLLPQSTIVTRSVNGDVLKTSNTDTPPRHDVDFQTKSSDGGKAEGVPKNSNKISRNPTNKSPEESTSVPVVDLGSDWQGSEIDTVLGNDKSRLKAGARLLPQTSGEKKGIALEKAKRRSRVDLDIFLNTGTCVEGGYLQGLVKVLIRRGLKKSRAILVSGGKIRVVGFETTAKEEERSVFYQCSADLSDVSSGLGEFYCSGPDDEGFMEANEGIHVLPFTLLLNSSQDGGKPKGYMKTQSGVSVRYIVMVSLRIKDPTSGKLSISHFYRECCIWPQLNASVILSPASHPIQMTSDGLVFGGNGNVILTASLHRIYWLAGQLCHVRFDVTNNSKKHLKVLIMELFQTISIFKPKKSKSENDDDIYHPTTIKKQIARSILINGKAGTRGHASAEGWWVGVPPKSSQTFSHCIHLPADCLTVPRSKLLEVSYNIKATISSGTLISTDIDVSIPLEIINFLSIDPPPPPLEIVNKAIKTSNFSGTCEQNMNIHDMDSDGDSEDLDEGCSDDDLDELGNLSVHDDTDEVVEHVVSSARIDDENAPRFADLYYSSIQGTSKDLDIQKNPDSTNIDLDRELPKIHDCETKKRTRTHFADRVEEKMARRKTKLVQDDDDLIQVSRDYPKPLVNVFKPSLLRKHDGPNSLRIGPLMPAVLDSNNYIGPRIPLKGRESTASDIIDSDPLPSGSKDGIHPPPHKIMSGSRSNPVTPNRHPSIEMLTTSATRPKSVRDKIRELEELAAGLCEDA